MSGKSFPNSAAVIDFFLLPSQYLFVTCSYESVIESRKISWGKKKKKKEKNKKAQNLAARVISQHFLEGSMSSLLCTLRGLTSVVSLYSTGPTLAAVGWRSRRGPFHQLTLLMCMWLVKQLSQCDLTAL